MSQIHISGFGCRIIMQSFLILGWQGMVQQVTKVTSSPTR